MLRIFAFIAIALSLAGCQTAPGSFSDVHTGQRGYKSARVSASSGLFTSLYATVAYSENARKFAIATEYSSVASGWLFLEQAWSFGRQFRYVVASRDTAMCDSNGCIVIERGAFEISREDAERAAKEGMEFKLIGSKGSIIGKLPPTVFQQVLQQLRGEKPTS